MITPRMELSELLRVTVSNELSLKIWKAVQLITEEVRNDALTESVEDDFVNDEKTPVERWLALEAMLERYVEDVKRCR